MILFGGCLTLPVGVCLSIKRCTAHKKCWSEEKDLQWLMTVFVFMMTTQFHTVLLCLQCGGPCHLSSIKQCSDDLVFLWEQNKDFFLSLYLYLFNIVSIQFFILFWILNFFLKTTQCSFDNSPFIRLSCRECNVIKYVFFKSSTQIWFDQLNLRESTNALPNVSSKWSTGCDVKGFSGEHNEMRSETI